MSEIFDAYYKWLGIPPAEQPPHHYRLLGIRPFESDPDVISHAADRQMAHLRTFQLGQHAETAQALLNEIAAARTVLLDSQKKRAYDARLRSLVEAAAEPVVPPLQAPPLPTERAEPADAAPQAGTFIAPRKRSPRLRSIAARRNAAKWWTLGVLCAATIGLAVAALLIAWAMTRGRQGSARRIDVRRTTQLDREDTDACQLYVTTCFPGS